MNYPAMRYVASEDCTVKGPARAVLWVIAYHAYRHTGECWVGQRRLARESGLARATVQRALDNLFGDFILEPVEGHRGLSRSGTASLRRWSRARRSGPAWSRDRRALHPQSRALVDSEGVH